MAYCTQTDIENALPPLELARLTDDLAGDTTATAIVAAKIAEADSVIDAHVGKQYAVPVAPPVPALLTKFSVDISIKYLYERREVVPPTRQKAFEDAMKLLEEIKVGGLSLGVEPAPAPSSEVQAQYSGPAQVFTRDTLEGT